MLLLRPFLHVPRALVDTHDGKRRYPAKQGVAYETFYPARESKTLKQAIAENEENDMITAFMLLDDFD